MVMYELFVTLLQEIQCRASCEHVLYYVIGPSFLHLNSYINVTLGIELIQLGFCLVCKQARHISVLKNYLKNTTVGPEIL